MDAAEKSEELEDVVESDETEELSEDLETEGVEPGEEEEEESEAVELEEWEKTGEEEDALPDVPVATHIKAKEKWKRKSQAKDAELEALKAEIESLKTGVNRTDTSELKRPDPIDFEDDEAYEDAKEQYLINKIRLKDKEKERERQKKELNEAIARGVEVHYERVEKFVTEKKINPDVYKAAESTLVKAIDEVFPKMGEANLDFYLSKLGEGSEKIAYFLGRNKAKLTEFQELLRKDPSGISAGIFLGAENARIRGLTTGKPKSKAPAPAKTASGDITPDRGSESKLKKQYDNAHAKGDGDKAWDIRKQARAAGIDVKSW